MEGIRYESEEKREYNPKDLRPNRRKPTNASDLVYIEVMPNISYIWLMVEFWVPSSALLTDILVAQDLVTEVQRALYATLSEFEGNVEDENDLELLIELQFEALQKALKIPHKASEARLMVSKKFLTLFRTGKLGQFILDDVPDTAPVSWIFLFVSLSM